MQGNNLDNPTLPLASHSHASQVKAIQLINVLPQASLPHSNTL